MSQRIPHIRGDIFGGITAGIVALPLALAFGVHSGMGASAGLYGAIVLGFFAALLGGTNTQVSGPTGPMTVISAVVIAEAIEFAGSLDQALGMILFTFLLAGAFQILFGIVRIGGYIRYIPYPVISGFMTGIGVIIIILQLFPLVGAASPPNTLDVIMELPSLFSQFNWAALAIAAGTIAIIYILPRITRMVPSELVALCAMTAISAFTTLNVPIIGDIPSGLPPLQLDKILGFEFLSNFHLVLVPALTLAALGTIDSLLTSVVADNITKTRHRSNKELIGQGIGNMFVSLFGGIPGAGATMRTVVNISAGGRTRLSGIIHSLLLLVILLSAGGLAGKIPLATLAGILITVGLGIIDYKGLKHFFRIPRTDAAVMLIVFAMTVFVDLLQAVIVGLILSSVLFMKKMGETNAKLTHGHRLTEQDDQPSQEEQSLPKELAEKIYIKYLHGPLFFGFTTEFQTMLQTIEPVKVIILNMQDVPFVDQSGLYALEEAIRSLNRQGLKIAITNLQSQPKDRMQRINLIPGLISDDQIFASFAECKPWLSSLNLIT